MAFSTVLTPTAGLPGKPYGLFTKGAAPPVVDGGKPYTQAFTQLTPTGGLPGRRYGSFAGKGTSVTPPDVGRSGTFTGLMTNSGLPGRYRYGSFVKGDPAIVMAETRPAGGGRGRRRRRAFIDGRMVEGTEEIRTALTAWTARLEKQAQETKAPVEKRPKVTIGKKAVEAPPARTITEQEVSQFADALRALNTRDAEVKAFLAHYRALMDDEDNFMVML